MTNEQKCWKLIENAQWKSDHNYDRISDEWSKLPNDEFQELKKFIHGKAKELGNKYYDAWLGKDGGPGFDVSDDGWSDLRYDVIGRGEEFYDSITVDKLREMADDLDYEESFSYCLQIQTPTQPEKTEFEENNPKRLQEFLIELDKLVDEYHPNIYLIDGVFEGIETAKKAIRKKLEDEI
jgi:hypothetical protein